MADYEGLLDPVCNLGLGCLCKAAAINPETHDLGFRA